MFSLNFAFSFFERMSPKKKIITYPNLKAYPMATSRHIWSECVVVKDLFWKLANDNQTEAQIPLEQSSHSYGESATPEYKTLFMDHKEGEGIFVNPRSILRMRRERVEVAWTELRLETKSQSN